jgi:hypothetical protein
MNFKVELKPVAKGTKTRATVLLDGKSIGTRTSGHTYRFALVVTGNQAHALVRQREVAVYHIQVAEKYAAIAARQNPQYQKAVVEFGFASVEKNITSGQYATWEKGYREAHAKALAEVARLEANQNLPEFKRPFVVSWHHRRDLVPSAKPWQTFVAVVELEPTVEVTINR